VWFMSSRKRTDQTLLDDDNILEREPLQANRNVTRLKHASADLSITDGPFAETKEHLGGILVLESEE
jgi:hypothetical protein